ncbi:THAP domain-containing protein 3 isoform X5 [Ixodes scapularis]|uniref:THAP domain-containing protein 3 isoform X5 n=1 Tax=Ixodes scapularis TaxID=6945 RepID=UPI001C38722C|nr:THAP domain-containing protein 3 isoform X5 [Ixodes scapularis]
MPFCAVGGCFTKEGDGKRLLRFPLAEKDRERLRAWLELVDRENFQTTPHSRICEDHFEESQFETSRADGRRLLKWNAVPSIPASVDTQKRPRSKVRRKASQDQHSRGRRITSPELMPGQENAVQPSKTEIEASAPTEKTKTNIQAQSEKPKDKMQWGYFETSEHLKYLDTSRPLEMEQQCNGQQCVHQAIVTELQSKLNLQQQRKRKLEKELEAVLGSRHENLAPEQQLSTMNHDAHVNRWRADTLQKVLLRCESRKDGLPKDEAIPLISERTLKRQIREIQSETGIHEERLPALQSKRQTTSPEERHRTLLVNEIRLNAGLDFDTTVEKPAGPVTMKATKVPGSARSLPDACFGYVENKKHAIC